MFRYAAVRVLWLVPTLLAMALVTFLVMHATPGSPLDPVAEDANPLPPEAQRNHARDAGILDARQRTDARENLRHHRRSRTVVDARRAQVRVDEQYVLRIRETDVDG